MFSISSGTPELTHLRQKDGKGDNWQEKQPFHHLKTALLVETDDVEGFPVSALDPLDPLQLWVNHQRPLDRLGEDGGILSGHRVAWKSFIVPSGYSCIVGQKG